MNLTACQAKSLIKLSLLFKSSKEETKFQKDRIKSLPASKCQMINFQVSAIYIIFAHQKFEQSIDEKTFYRNLRLPDERGRQ